MIAAVVIPAFDLRAALRLRPGLEAEPAALAPLPGTEPLIGSVTQAAQAKGVKPGMRLGEALATCPALVLVEQDPAGVEQAWEEVLHGLENAGFAVEPAEPGTALFDTNGVERLYGGLEPALRRALAAVGPAWDARAGGPWARAGPGQGVASRPPCGGRTGSRGLASPSVTPNVSTPSVPSIDRPHGPVIGAMMKNSRQWGFRPRGRGKSATPFC